MLLASSRIRLQTPTHSPNVWNVHDGGGSSVLGGNTAMHASSRLGYRTVSAALAFVMVGSWLAIAKQDSARADTAPPDPTTPVTVSADSLPTVQIDGVVWQQAIVGNTVYAGGSFANARPAGSAAGTNLTPRNNFLSYDITTGALNSAFAPDLNAQVEAVAASPDG